MKRKIMSLLLSAVVAVPLMAGTFSLEAKAAKWDGNVYDLEGGTVSDYQLNSEIADKTDITIQNGTITGKAVIEGKNVTFKDIKAEDGVSLSSGTITFKSGTYGKIGTRERVFDGTSYVDEGGTGSIIIDGGTFGNGKGAIQMGPKATALKINGGTFIGYVTIDSPAVNVSISDGQFEDGPYGQYITCYGTSDVKVISSWLASGRTFSTGKILSKKGTDMAGQSMEYVSLDADGTIKIVDGTWTGGTDADKSSSSDSGSTSGSSSSSSSATTAADYAAKTTVSGVDGVTVNPASAESVKNAQDYAKNNSLNVATVVELTKPANAAAGPYTLSITVKGASFDKDTVEILHWKNDGTMEKAEIISASGETVTFKVSDFSPFAVVTKTKVEGTSPVDAELGTTTWNGSSFDGAKITSATKNMVTAVSANLKSTELKPSGAADVKVNVVSGAAKDNLLDNGVHPAVKKFVENRAKALAGSPQAGKADASNIKGIYYFDLTASQPGDITFKLEDALTSVMSGDAFAIVLHYTGNAADEDGITAQYCKISSAGKVTAHFNSFSPVAIIATNVESAQTLVNTYSHDAGSDAAGAQPAATTNVPTAAPAAVTTDAAANAAAQPTAGAAAANTTNAAGTKGAASPKTGDTNDLSVLLLLAAGMAAATLVRARAAK